jgi:hypothetical protein
MGTAPNTIQIRGMTYTVEIFTRCRDGKSECAYRLIGKRGARYETLRNVPKPEMMFLIHSDRFGPVAVMNGVWLTDEGGTLRVVRS